TFSPRNNPKVAPENRTRGPRRIVTSVKFSIRWRSGSALGYRAQHRCRLSCRRRFSAGLAGSRPDVELPVERVAVDPLQLILAEGKVAQRPEATLDRVPAAGADGGTRDGRLAKHPRDGHLRQGLAALLRNLIERADVGEIGFTEHPLVERAVLRGTRA